MNDERVIQHVDDFLEHYGVLGMKWGVRKDKTNALRNSKKVKQKQLSKKTIKVLKQKVNDIHNDALDIHQYVMSKVESPEANASYSVSEHDLETAINASIMSSERAESHPNKKEAIDIERAGLKALDEVTHKYFKERMTKANDIIKKEKISKNGTTVKYSVESNMGTNEYFYNGQLVDVRAGRKFTEADLFLLDPPKDIEHSDSLAHYGVLGMKWGVRKDSKGIRRGTPSADKVIKKDRKKAVKKRRLLSDRELETRITRLKAEKQLRTLTAEEITPGKSFVNDIMINAGKKVVGGIVTGALIYAVKAGVEKQFDVSDFGKYVIPPKPKAK